MAISINEYLIRIKKGYLDHGVLYIFVICGITGMLVDIDHLPKLLDMLMGGQGYPNGRTLHPLFFLIALGVCILCGKRLLEVFLKYRARKET
jgi:cytochrome b subunit of formate dehydrogenase